ncbi:MAG: hypothetical protein WB729_16090 [Candidatus Sulfotelmatobacter sp.]
MILTSRLWIFIAAFAGGCLGEFLTLYEESRNDPSVRTRKIRDFFYWRMAFIMALVGGALAILYDFKEIHVFAAINIGASAPVLIKSGFASFTASAKPPIS